MNSVWKIFKQYFLEAKCVTTSAFTWVLLAVCVFSSRSPHTPSHTHTQHTHTHTHACMHSHMHARTHIHTCMHAHIHARTHARTHTHTHTHYTNSHFNYAYINTHPQPRSIDDDSPFNAMWRDTVLNMDNDFAIGTLDPGIHVYMQASKACSTHCAYVTVASSAESLHCCHL